MTDDARRWAEGRRRLGLTQGQVADLLGTSQANVSAYERGHLVPGDVVAARLDALAALGPSSVYRYYQASTLASSAALLRGDLRRGVADADLLRHVIQAADDFGRLHDDADRALFLCEPSPTGSPGWDALLAGIAVDLCRSAALERTPAWTRDRSRRLDTVWWVGRPDVVVSARPAALQDSLPALRARGVILSRRILESV